MNRKYKYLIIALVVILIAVSVIYYYVNLNFNTAVTSKGSPSSGNYSSYFYLNPVSNSDVASYKASCKDVNIDDMIHNPESYKGQKIKETGRIDNMTYNSAGYTEILLYTPDTNRNFTRLYVTYKGQVPYNIGDSITVYGEVDLFTEYALKMSFLKAVYTQKN